MTDSLLEIEAATEADTGVQRLYTPAMLAELLHVPVAQLRRWQRRGWLRPAREVRRLAYFDFSEVVIARRLRDWLAEGLSGRALQQYDAELRKLFPAVDRPLAELPLVLEGRRLLLRQREGLAELHGQRRFEFEPQSEEEARVYVAPQFVEGAKTDVLPLPLSATTSAAELVQLAADLEDDGRLAEAADAYRAALAAGGPAPETCFSLAELLYRQGDLSAARERYYNAIELDENYVEARANLGCVLAEQGQRELAAAAFAGAIAHHPDYADAHYHLARTLDELQRAAEAAQHWESFLKLAPESPWADAARERLGLLEEAVS